MNLTGEKGRARTSIESVYSGVLPREFRESRRQNRARVHVVGRRTKVPRGERERVEFSRFENANSNAVQEGITREESMRFGDETEQ